MMINSRQFSTRVLARVVGRIPGDGARCSSINRIMTVIFRGRSKIKQMDRAFSTLYLLENSYTKVILSVCSTVTYDIPVLSSRNNVRISERWHIRIQFSWCSIKNTTTFMVLREKSLEATVAALTVLYVVAFYVSCVLIKTLLLKCCLRNP